MPSIESLVRGSEKLTAIFGRWPSFHDAEIIEINLTRKPAGGRGENAGLPNLIAKIHLWEMTSEIDAKGYYVTKNHTLVTLRFLNLQELKLEGFNHQNVIFGLTIEPFKTPDSSNSRFHVEFDPSFGIDAVFNCSSIEVVDVTTLADSHSGL